MSTGAVSAVTPASATVGATVNPHGLATTFYVEYGLSSSSGFSSKTPAKSAGSGTVATSASVTITGLSPATSYHYRVVATSSAGTTEGSTGVLDTTAAPSVLTGAATEITSTSAVLGATVNPQAKATSWYFEYGTSTAYGSKTAQGTVSAGPNPVSVTAKVTGLKPQATYHFRIVATSSAGTSYGSDETLQTGLAVTLNVNSTQVVYGRFAHLQGTVASHDAGVQVTVMAKPFDQPSYRAVGTVKTTAGGSWQYRAQPTARTTFQASVADGTSSEVVVGVAPAVLLSRLRNGKLSTRVVAAISFGGHVLQLQRLERGLWVTWKHVRLSPTGRAVFATRLPRGRTLVRMAIGPFVRGINQAAPGYLAGYSRSLAYIHR